METTVHEEKKIIAIYLTRAERENPKIDERLHDIYAHYKGKKYMVAVLYSGEKDLYQNTLDLLIYNKKRAAEREIRRQKEENPEQERTSTSKHLHHTAERNQSAIGLKKSMRMQS